MSLQLDISESITASLRLPEDEIEPRLRMELAIALYGQGILSLGKAAELASVSRFEFSEMVGSRGVSRHYTEEDLAADLRYARS